MGNGCCSEDRHYQQSLPENAKLQTIVSAIKNVESVLPKLEKETNRTRQTLTYLTTESDAVNSDLLPCDPVIKHLREEIYGYQGDIQTLLFKGSGRDQPISRGPRKRTIVRSKTTIGDHPERDSGGKETADGLVDIELTFKALEIAYKEVQDMGGKLGTMKVRLSKAKNQLEINVLNSIQVLSAEVQNLIGANEDAIKEGIPHDEAIAHLAQLAKPSVIHQRMLSLQKELEDMKEIVGNVKNRVEIDLREIEEREKGLKDVELFAFELVGEMKDALGSSPPSVPVREKEGGKEGEKEGEKGGKAREEKFNEDYYKSQLEELSSILTSKEGKLTSVASSLSKTREMLEDSKDEVKTVKARVLLYVGKLRETRVLLRVVRMWRVGVERGKLEEMETRRSTDGIRHEKMENRRKFTRLMKVLNKNHEFVTERSFQRMKEAAIRLSYRSSGRPSAISPYKMMEIQVKSLVSGIQKYENRVLRWILWRIRNVSRSKKSVFRLKFIISRLILFQLHSGMVHLKFAKRVPSKSEMMAYEELGLDLMGENVGLRTTVPEFPVCMSTKKSEEQEKEEQYQFEPASEDEIKLPTKPIFEFNPSLLPISKSTFEAGFNSESIPSDDSIIEENLDEGQRRINIQGQSTRLGSVPFSRPSYHY